MTPIPPDVAPYVDRLIRLGFLKNPVVSDHSNGFASFKLYFTQYVIDNLPIGERRHMDFDLNSFVGFDNDNDLAVKLAVMMDIPVEKTMGVLKALGA
ncbi:hypothetical protein KDX23_02895 [Burkholderia vietnamiensis]|uniref:hypothetical protein n=1 Tax=Burkholderia vietnamiensis TaxID=60552 RepID=UPI001B9955AC|nr:hypothetical protein [Burkholderia vietnamiensis]MBR8081687.1 hypothetical protein [Burkholderia vietnamiensis]